MDRTENEMSSNPSIVGCVFAGSVTFSPSRCPAAYTDTRTNGRHFEALRSDGFRCHDIHIKFHEDWVRLSKVEWGGGGFTHTYITWRSHKPIFIFFK
jgi:hypothetical protein